jgi:tetratricopeptide (TPR) repeat protein
MMRVLHRALIIGIAGAMLAAPVAGQKADDQLHPRSVQLLREGEALIAAGKFVEADDALEAALAVDPRNRAAFVAMARVAHRQKLYGQAIRFTNKALLLEPTDRQAIAVQGQAMVELGALARARDNLAKLQKLCPTGCAELAALNSAIARGPTIVAAQARPAGKTTN